MSTIRNIKTKLLQHNAIITIADKGQTLIITDETEYNTKTYQFLNNVHFKTTMSDLTNTFQKEVKKVTKSCPILIPQDTKWKYSNMNPKAPNIRALIKLHKPNAPIRPIVNWQHAPAYKLARYISDKLKAILELPYTFNIKNSQQLINDLCNTTEYNQNLRLASFDITNMYTNIPTGKIMPCISQICKLRDIPNDMKIEITKIVYTVLKQNYFDFDNHTFKQIDGLAMGAPTSALFSEIYIQMIEHTKIYKILVVNNICNYLRYVDDIILVYDVTVTDIMTVLNQFNCITTNLQFTAELESNRQLNFLDLAIRREQENFGFNIYRKPTTTDHIIPDDSCHPLEHKCSAIRFLTQRLETYPLNEADKRKERNTIQHILKANKYGHSTLTKSHPKPDIKMTQEEKKVKRAIFTYTGPHVRKITKLFHSARLKTAFTTKHTIQKLLRAHQNQTNFNGSGVYQLECGDCNRKYVGQTGRSFRTHFKEHKGDFDNNHNKSLFAKHLIEGHSLQPIESCMKILEYNRKIQKLHTLEQYHIYRLTKTEHPLNEQYADMQNPIFESILKVYPIQR
jgi:hypothetical protein